MEWFKLNNLKKFVLSFKAQGQLPWAFFASLAFHLVILGSVLIFSEDIKRSKFGRSFERAFEKSSMTVNVQEAQHRSVEQVLLVTQAKSPPPESVKAAPAPSEEIILPVHSQRDPEPVESHQVTGPRIQPIAIPSGIVSIWGHQPSRRENSTFQSAEHAQWQARKVEALRQLAILEQSFASAPRPHNATDCVITYMTRQCSQGGDTFGDYWAARLAYIFSVDPGFSPIEMRYETTSGWYAVIQKPSTHPVPTGP
jgi:hypothetical protein